MADSKIPPCRCGSGGHPRECERHPLQYAAHVAELNFINVLDDPEPGEGHLVELRQLYAEFERAERADAQQRREYRVAMLREILVTLGEAIEALR